MKSKWRTMVVLLWEIPTFLTRKGWNTTWDPKTPHTYFLARSLMQSWNELRRLAKKITSVNPALISMSWVGTINNIASRVPDTHRSTVCFHKLFIDNFNYEFAGITWCNYLNTNEIYHNWVLEFHNRWLHWAGNYTWYHARPLVKLFICTRIKNDNLFFLFPYHDSVIMEMYNKHKFYNN